MLENPGFLLTVLAFVAVIGPLVFVHEFGHYIVGRWCGVKAEAFSIGFGPELLAWVDKRGTRWRLAALPLGGYVRFKGDMNAASQADPAWLQMSAQDRAESFPAKPVWQRAAIVAAGP
ncbi:site-2 protease family protein, partial [Sphingobium sp. ba1]|uniref:site-2 protease family protein n=2 Tax=unclassified Sphingobium TaxID=2611147 RepID=UPI0005692BDF